MLHEKVSPCAEREGSNCRVWAQESLVIAVERDAVCPRGVVVDQAEVELAVGRCLGRTAEVIETLGNRPRRIPLVALVLDLESGLDVYD